MRILIIPDAHAHPNYDNDRFDLLGSFISRELPDIIVSIGDWADMPSLSSYDKGTKGFEGRRYSLDVDAANDALDRVSKHITALNRTRAKQHKAKYLPRKLVTLGNHEHRINKLVGCTPNLEGTISMGDLEFEKHGWEVYPFAEPVQVNGFAMCHHLPSGVGGRPVGGDNIARKLLTTGHCSAIVGHSHVLDYSERTTYLGNKLMAMSVGCFVHPAYREEWCISTRPMWWEGLIMLDCGYADMGFGSVKHYPTKELVRTL